MTTTVDLTVLRGLERCELAAWREVYRAARPESVRACGLEVAEGGGVLTTIAARLDVLGFNRTLGLGLDRPPTDRELDGLTETVAGAGVARFFVQLAPGVAFERTRDRLLERGFRHHNVWVKLYRDVAEPPPVRTELVVRRIDRRHAGDFGAITAACFRWPEAAVDWMADLVGHPGWQVYLAFDDDVPVAAGASFLDGRDAWIAFGATLPNHRGRGAQSALLARRIRDAAALGARRLVVETAQATPERPSPSHRNVRRLGFREAYPRPNFIYDHERPRRA